MAKDYSKEEVLEIIGKIAEQNGIPKDDFMRFAYIETGGLFNEQASRGQNGAKGLFQFVPGTAREYGISGRELDAEANTDAAARLYLDNQRMIIRGHEKTGMSYLSGESKPTGLDMYMAHQQGSAGYASIQHGLTDGKFTRDDTRPHILNNVSSKDIESITGMTIEKFGTLSDKDLASTFVAYWGTKFDRICISEVGVEPKTMGQPTAHAYIEAKDAATQKASINANNVLKLGENGSDIRDVQQLLNTFGYRDIHDHPLKADGDFGQKTKEAMQAFQQAHGLKDDGVVGANTLEALKKAEQSPLLSNPNHPDHALYQQALSGIEKLPSNSFHNNQERQSAAATIVFEAKVSGMKQIDHVVLSKNGEGLFAVQGAINDPAHHRIHIDKTQAATQPIEKSSVQLQQETQQTPPQVQQQNETRRMLA